MKSITKILFGLVLVFFVFSCGSSVDHSLPPNERIQGEWIIVKAEGSMAERNMGTIYTFEGDVMTTGGAATGTFTMTDSTLVWDLVSMEMKYDFHFEENTLVFSLNSGQTLYLEKQ